MNPYDTPRAAIRNTSGHDLREAPAGILTACKRQAKWILTLSVMFAGLAAVAVWIGIEDTVTRRLQIEFGIGTPPDGMGAAAFGYWIAAALCAANGAMAFRYYRGLRSFARDRRVTVLHSAMCRMRAFTRLFGITLFLTGAALTVLYAGASLASWKL